MSLSGSGGHSAAFYQQFVPQFDDISFPALLTPEPPHFEGQTHKATRLAVAVLAFRAAFNRITGREIPSQWNPLSKSSIVSRTVRATETLMEAKISPYPWAYYRLSQIIDEDATVGMATSRFSSVFGTTSVSLKNMKFYLSGEVDNKYFSRQAQTQGHKAYLSFVDKAVSQCVREQMTREQAVQHLEKILTRKLALSYSAQAQVEAKRFSDHIRGLILIGRHVW